MAQKKESQTEEPIEEETVKTNDEIKGQNNISERQWDQMTGRDLYFKPEPNKDYKLVIAGWKVDKIGLKGEPGLKMKVVSVNGKPIENDNGYKEWNTSAKRIIKQLEPVIKQATDDGRGQIVGVFRKALGIGENDTEAKFTFMEETP